MISNLQRETKAKLINACSPVGESLWIAVAIIGEIDCVSKAYKAISAIVEDGESRN